MGQIGVTVTSGKIEPIQSLFGNLSRQIFYDGDCNLCFFYVNLLRQISSSGTFKFIPQQKLTDR
jgi:hypothetical protein